MGHEGPAFALIERSEQEADALVRRIRPAHDALAATAQARLGLAELPARVERLSAGMVYAAACAEQAVRVPLAAAALASSLATGKSCALVTPAAPGIFLRKARLAGFELNPALKSGALTICQVSADAPKHLFRLGVQTLLAQLEPHVAAREALVVIDQADALFIIADGRAAAEAPARYADWAAVREHSVLALFAPSLEAAREFLTLKRVAENLAGFALARGAAGGALFEVRHWFGAEGPSARETFELRLPGTQSRAPVAQALHRAAEPLAAADGVICVRGALNAPASWQRWEEVESIAHAVDAARRSEAATLLLPFERPAGYETLAQAVAEVRAMERASLRLVVRERALRLRSSQTLALMRLGASSVIPADVPDAAVKRMIDALHGTRFARPYDTDVRQVEEETVSLLGMRSHNRNSFCETVERLLAASDGFDVDSCLTVLELGAAEPWRILAATRRHARELVAFAGAERAWLFWYGCRAEALPDILKRMNLDLRREVHGEPQSILGALERLRNE
jgi:hypothetical protein